MRVCYRHFLRGRERERKTKKKNPLKTSLFFEIYVPRKLSRNFRIRIELSLTVYDRFSTGVKYKVSAKRQ